jgi:hypothetical protein
MPKATESGAADDPKNLPGNKRQQPGDGEHAAGDGDDGRQKRVAEKRQEVERHLAKENFDAALPILKKLAALTHESTQETAVWARRQLQIVTRRAAQSQEQTAAVCRLARQMMEQRDYTGAVRVLADVSEIEATDESRELLEEAREIVSELAVLAGEIDSAMDSQRYDDARPLVARYLKLKPKDKKVREISDRLNSYGGKGGSKAGFSRDRSYGKSEGFGIGSAMGMTLVVSGLAFAFGLYLVTSYLKKNQQIVPVVVDSSVPTQEITLGLEGDLHSVAELGLGLKLKPGVHTIRLARNNAEVAKADVTIESKELPPSLRIEMRNGAPALIVVPSALNSRGSMAQAPAAETTPVNAPGAVSPVAMNNPAPAAPAPQPTAPAVPANVGQPADLEPTMAQAEVVAQLLARHPDGAMFTINETIGNTSGSRSFRTAADVPSGPLSITQVSFRRTAETPFTDEDVALLKNFTALDNLMLSGSGWTGDELRHFDNHPRLTNIFISSSEQATTDSIPPFRAMSHVATLANLRSLQMRGFSLTDADLEALKGLSKLNSLELGVDGVTSTGLASLSSHKELTGLSLSWGVKGARGPRDGDLDFLKSMPSLQRISVAPALEITTLPDLTNVKSLASVSLGIAPRFDDTGFVALVKSCPQLGMIEINTKNSLEPHLPEERSPLTTRSIEALKGMPRLFHVSLSGARGIGNDMSALGTLPNLGAAMFRDCGVNSNGVRQLAQCQKLQNLALYDMPIGDDSCVAIATLPKLQALNLSKTAITDQGFATVAKIPSLRMLGLLGTKVTRDAVNSVKRNNPQLQIVGL